MTKISAKRLRKIQPVLVTGLGVYSSAGCNTNEFFKKISCGVAFGDFHEVEGGKLLACAAPAVNTALPGFRVARKMDRLVQMAVHAAWEAWENAGLAVSSVSADRVAVFAGTARGPLSKWNESEQRYSMGRMRPSLAPNTTIACLSGALALTFCAQGPAATISSACTSSAHAIAMGAQQIIFGMADVAIVGGSEAPLIPSLFSQMKTAGLLGAHSDPKLACRPFSTLRNGTILGEGSAFLILESESSVRKRNAKVLARLAGWAFGTDVGQRTGISDGAIGMRNTVINALQMAEMTSKQIHYFHTHGTGTIINDRQEARVLSEVFPSGVPCSSTKPVTGHCMGAAAAMGAVAGILAINRGIIPPSANCDPIDPTFEIDLVQHAARKCKIDAVMTHAAGFWGNNGSLIFSRG